MLLELERLFQMSILHNTKYLQALSDTNLFIDTNILIGALAQVELRDFLFNLKSHNCEILSIPAVVTEFLRGSNSLAAYQVRAEFIESITGIYAVERIMEEMQDFVIVMNFLSPDADYTDFLLAVCSYKFKCPVLTGNHKDFPLTIFKRVNIITIDTGKEIRNYGFYQISEDKFNKAAEKILAR